MRSLQEEYFDDAKLCNYALDDIGDVTTNSNDPEEWTFVYARTSDRGSPLYSEGICRVLGTTTSGSLAQEAVETVSTDEILDRMPKSPRDRMAVPSPSGDYLSVMEVRATELDDGTVEPETRGRSSVIPVEYVIEPLSYDEVIARLIDETL